MEKYNYKKTDRRRVSSWQMWAFLSFLLELKLLEINEYKKSLFLQYYFKS